MTGPALEAVLADERIPIIDSAAESIRRARTHYESAGNEETRRRLEALFDQVLAAVTTRTLAGIVDYETLEPNASRLATT